MIKEQTFQNSDTYIAKSMKEAISLSEKLRCQDKTTPYTIIIEGDGRKEEANLKFQESGFRIILRNHTLVSHLYANMKDENGKDLTTWKTAALKITGSHNIFHGLHVENDSGEPETKGQEVALRIYGDDNLFSDCTLISTQDTLFVGPLPDDLSTRYLGFLPEDERYYEGNTRNYFRNCTIKGSIDFIFGAGQAVFDTCDLVSVNDSRNTTYVVASANSLKDDFGFLFYQCRFMKDEDVKPDSVYLARPWRDYAKAVFIQCTYQDHIRKEGFADWSDVSRIQTARFLEYPLGKSRVGWTKNKPGSEPDRKYIDAIEELRKSINTK